MERKGQEKRTTLPARELLEGREEQGVNQKALDFPDDTMEALERLTPDGCILCSLDEWDVEEWG